MANDRDCNYPMLVRDGVNLGVDEPISRSPDVFPTKEELTDYLDDSEPDKPTWHDNYPSAREHMDAIVETYKEETPDMVTGPHSPTEAAKICQCTASELCHGALAGKPEGRYLDKLRTIHDATVNNVNPWIQYHLTERTTAPTLHDLLHVLCICDTNNLVLLKLDVTKAHRRIKVRRCDWKYITALINDQIWVNKCGTYGVASAQYYWGRMAALNLRLLYYLFPDIRWAFVYVDDFIIVLDTKHHKALALAIILTMTAWGCPLSWKKTSLGEVSNWLGYQVNCRTITSTMTPDKQIIMTNILRKLLQGAQHTDNEVVSNTGRLQWATAICPQMRPFLQPLYSWMIALQDRRAKTRKDNSFAGRTAGKWAYGRPPQLVQLMAATMLHIINNTTPPHTPPTCQLRITAATDAGADDSHARIGGWYSTVENPAQTDVHWFTHQITPEVEPWAHPTPQHHIATLEMYATVLMFQHISSTSTHATVEVLMITDNKGNSYSALNYKSKSWPHAGVLMELALTTYYRNVHPNLQHVHRELNTWADQLTHNDTARFTPSKQFSANTKNFYILDRLHELTKKPEKGRSPRAWDS